MAPVSFSTAEDWIMGDSPVLVSSSVDSDIYLYISDLKNVTAHLRGCETQECLLGCRNSVPVALWASMFTSVDSWATYYYCSKPLTKQVSIVNVGARFSEVSWLNIIIIRFFPFGQ